MVHTDADQDVREREMFSNAPSNLFNLESAVGFGVSHDGLVLYMALDGGGPGIGEDDVGLE